MKKPFILLVSFLLIVMFTSCSPDIPKDYIMPVFTKAMSSSNSRGLMEMPTWDENKWRSAGVMQALPAMIGLEEVKKNNFEEIMDDAKRQDVFEVLGFDLLADTKAWRENDDGFYVKYDILYDGNRIGFVQYYYNSTEKVFSYRQMILLTLQMGQEIQTALYALEYKDIPVRNLNQLGRFTFGHLDENRATERNAFADRISFNTDGTFKFVRSYISGTSDKKLFASIFRPDMTYGTEDFDNADIANAINGLRNSNNNGIIDKISEAENATLGFIYSIIGEFYANANGIRNGDSETHGFSSYSSYEDFKSATLDDVKIRGGHEPIRKNSSSYDGMAMNPVAYSWSDGTAASATIPSELYGSGSTQGVFLDIILENFEKTGFNDFYKINASTDEDLRKNLIREHLKACGLSNENFIENFTYAALNEEYGRATYWPYGVTTENPESFKEHFKNPPKSNT